MLKTIPCPDCDGRGFITEFTEYSVSGKKCSACDGLGQIEVPMTNADRIRAMSDEELAIAINAFSAYFDECNRSSDDVECKGCELYKLCSLHCGDALEWLKRPAEEE